jgi:hypothetical protein
MKERRQAPSVSEREENERSVIEGVEQLAILVHDAADAAPEILRVTVIAVFQAHSYLRLACLAA